MFTTSSVFANGPRPKGLDDSLRLAMFVDDGLPNGNHLARPKGVAAGVKGGGSVKGINAHKSSKSLDHFNIETYSFGNPPFLRNNQMNGKNRDPMA